MSTDTERRFRLCWQTEDGAEDSVLLTGTIAEIQVAAIREMKKRGISIDDAWSVEEEATHD